MIKFISALLVTTALVGCANTIPAPTTPTPQQIAAENVALMGTGVDPVTYFQTGALLNAQNCHAWFDSLASRSTNISTLGTLVGVGGASAAAINPAAGAGAAIAMGLASGALSALNNSTGIPYPVATGGLAEQSLATFLNAVTSQPTTLAGAALLVDAEAQLCSQRGVEALVNQAIMTAPTGIIPVVGAPTTAPVVVTMPVSNPPVITTPPVVTTPVTNPPVTLPPPPPGSGGPIFPSITPRTRTFHHVVHHHTVAATTTFVVPAPSPLAPVFAPAPMIGVRR